jgi:hypothetical protein
MKEGLSMAGIARRNFPHRQNPDGSFDSICIECFQTIASNTVEGELAPHESRHLCFGFDLEKSLHPENHIKIEG